MIWTTIIALILWGLGLTFGGISWVLVKNNYWRGAVVVLAILLTAGAFGASGMLWGKSYKENIAATVLRWRFDQVILDLGQVSDDALRKEYLDDLRGVDMFSESSMADKLFEQHTRKWRLKLMQPKAAKAID